MFLYRPRPLFISTTHFKRIPLIVRAHWRLCFRRRVDLILSHNTVMTGSGGDLENRVKRDMQSSTTPCIGPVKVMPSMTEMVCSFVLTCIAPLTQLCNDY